MQRLVSDYSRIKDWKSPLKGSRPSVPHGTSLIFFKSKNLKFGLFDIFTFFYKKTKKNLGSLKPTSTAVVQTYYTLKCVVVYQRDLVWCGRSTWNDDVTGGWCQRYVWRRCDDVDDDCNGALAVRCGDVIHVGVVERAVGHRASDAVLRPKEGRCDALRCVHTLRSYGPPLIGAAIAN